MEWTRDERRFLRSLNTPTKIQNHLYTLLYNHNDACASPRYVMMSGDGHCFEGCLLAMAALEFQGYPPLLVDLHAIDDDPHVIAVYKAKTGWGSIAKSNTTLLAGRKPYYASIHELVMSYFDLYFNDYGQPSLHSYSAPINLKHYEHWNWRTSDEDLVDLGISFTDLPHREIIGVEELKRLPKVNMKLLNASKVGETPAP